MLISPLNAFPWVLNGLMEAWVSLKRVQEFVALKDLDMQHYYSSCKGKFYCLNIEWTVSVPELQIRGSIEDNSKIIFSYFSTKTYVVTPL